MPDNAIPPTHTLDELHTKLGPADPQNLAAESPPEAQADYQALGAKIASSHVVTDVERVYGLALFDRKTRTTSYKGADSGYVSAWYLDEDYDGDCFVDCQMFFDFKKAPNLKAALRADVEAGEYKLQLESSSFPVRGYKRIAVKVVDVYGNESTMVREL